MKATKEMKAVWSLKLNLPAPPTPFKGSGCRQSGLRAEAHLPPTFLLPPSPPSLRPHSAKVKEGCGGAEEVVDLGDSGRPRATGSAGGLLGGLHGTAAHPVGRCQAGCGLEGSQGCPSGWEQAPDSASSTRSLGALAVDPCRGETESPQPASF